MVAIFKAHPRTVGVTPLILTLETSRHFRTVAAIATRRHRVLSSTLRVFGVGPSCSLGLVRGKRALRRVASSILAGVSNIVGGTSPSVVLIRKSAAAAFTTTLTNFCGRGALKRIRTKLQA